MFWPKQGRQYCGFLTIHWIPIFVDFVVALIHNIKFQFLIIYIKERIIGPDFMSFFENAIFTKHAKSTKIDALKY